MTQLVAQDQMNTLKTLFDKAQPQIRAVIPKHLTAERITRIALVAASRNPLLLQCDPMSILQAVMTASYLGLEPNTPLGHAYLIPYKNGHTGKYEAQFITGYRGLIELAMRSDRVTSIEAHAVYDCDEFHFELGTARTLYHKPQLDRPEKARIIAVYAVAELANGSFKFDVMGRGDVEGIRARSRSANHGPWVTDFQEMARKTVVRRFSKQLPLSPEFAHAVAADEAAERGEKFEPIDMEMSLPESEIQPSLPEEKESKTEGLRKRLGRPTNEERAARAAAEPPAKENAARAAEKAPETKPSTNGVSPAVLTVQRFLAKELPPAVRSILRQLIDEQCVLEDSDASRISIAVANAVELGEMEGLQKILSERTIPY